MQNTKRFLAILCFLGLLTALAAAQAMNSDSIEPTIFTPGDLTVNDLKLFATQNEAVEIFGTPESSETFTLEATGDTFEVWQYQDLTLTFNEMGKVIGAAVSGKEYRGPRGVQVGQTPPEVAGKYYVDPQFTTGAVFYTAGYVETLDAQLPPCGYVQQYDDGTFSINYVAPMEPFGDDVLSDLSDYIYQDLALFQVSFSAESVVTGFSWQVGPWAE